MHYSSTPPVGSPLTHHPYRGAVDSPERYQPAHFIPAATPPMDDSAHHPGRAHRPPPPRRSNSCTSSTTAASSCSTCLDASEHHRHRRQRRGRCRFCAKKVTPSTTSPHHHHQQRPPGGGLYRPPPMYPAYHPYEDMYGAPPQFRMCRHAPYYSPAMAMPCPWYHYQGYVRSPPPLSPNDYPAKVGATAMACAAHVEPSLRSLCTTMKRPVNMACDLFATLANACGAELVDDERRPQRAGTTGIKSSSGQVPPPCLCRGGCNRGHPLQGPRPPPQPKVKFQ